MMALAVINTALRMTGSQRALHEASAVPAGPS
jgi:hypothetical protein